MKGHSRVLQKKVSTQCGLPSGGRDLGKSTTVTVTGDLGSGGPGLLGADHPEDVGDRHPDLGHVAPHYIPAGTPPGRGGGSATATNKYATPLKMACKSFPGTWELSEARKETPAADQQTINVMS